MYIIHILSWICNTWNQFLGAKESLSVGAPLLVCPGFGDQLSNAARAEQLQLGTKVDRPKTGRLHGDGMAIGWLEICVFTHI